MPETTPKAPSVGEVRRQLEGLFGRSLHAGRTHFVIVAQDLDDPALSVFTCCDVHLPEEKEARAEVSEMLWEALMRIQDPDHTQTMSFEQFLAQAVLEDREAEAEERRGEGPNG